MQNQNGQNNSDENSNNEDNNEKNNSNGNDETVVEVLHFLLERCLAHRENLAALLPNSSGDLLRHLEKNGFSQEKIHSAFAWFANLLLQQNLTDQHCAQGDAMRILLPEERVKIGADGNSFLLSLEKHGILNSKTREVVIAQLMRLPQQHCSMTEIKWVTFMVLMSQNTDGAAITDQLEKYSLYLM
jgi:uncharacterized protein Smg (DUF494 family)